MASFTYSILHSINSSIDGSHTDVNSRHLHPKTYLLVWQEGFYDKVFQFAVGPSDLQKKNRRFDEDCTLDC